MKSTPVSSDREEEEQRRRRRQQQRPASASADNEQVAGEQESVEELDLCPSSEATFEERLREAIIQRRLARQRRSEAHKQESPQEKPIRTSPSELQEHLGQQDLSCQESNIQSQAKTTDLDKCISYPIYSRAILAPTASAPIGTELRHGSSSRGHGPARRQRRGSRYETTSLKLNRLLESSLSMLPQPNLSRVGRNSTSTETATTRTSGRHARQSSDKKQHKSTIRAPVAITANHPLMAEGDLQDHQNHRKQQQRLQLDESRSVSSKGSDESDEEDRDVDGGYAWVILAVVFMINASTFGTARAYGLIFDKQARVDNLSRTEAALPFTLMGSIENMAGPLSGYLLARTSSWRLTVFTGSCLVTAAHLLAALFSDSRLGQVSSMGVICGLGMSFVFISFFQVNNAYFVRYRNTAFGVGMTGAAFGTLYISPLCQYFLDNFEGTGMCYLMLGLIIAPNVPLSLLLKPKRSQGESRAVSRTSSFDSKKSGTTTAERTLQQEPTNIKTISEQIDDQSQTNPGLLTSVKLVIQNPLFHLIWPTQLLFCWFNFVFGMIIVDFGKDRGMSAQDAAHLIPIWSFGQLIGRLVLSTLVDLKFLSYRWFTIICFGAISVTTYILKCTRSNSSESPSAFGEFVSIFPSTSISATQQHLIILLLALVLSMFIALLYILLNGLIVEYVEKSLQPLSIGISSFTGSFFLLPRAHVIGHYRDDIGSYDAMFTMFALVSLCAAFTWLIGPTGFKYLRKFYANIRDSSHTSSHRKDVIAIMTPYSSLKLAPDGS